jgi:large subunit ribosomal protein L14
MVQIQTNVEIVDNSGVRVVRCVEILGRGKRSFGRIGDVFVGTVVSLRFGFCGNLRPKGQEAFFKRGSIVRCVIVRTLKGGSHVGVTGLCLRFLGKNAGILLKITEKPKRVFDKEPFGRRVLGPVSGDLRKRGFLKLLSLSRQHNVL